MGHCDNCKKVKGCFKDGCGKCGKVKLKIPVPAPSGINKSVGAQAITTTSTTILQLTNGSFSFNNITNSCCSPCNGNSNTNIICLKCAGIYNITVFVTVDTAPGAETVFLALDVGSQQVLLYPLTGTGTAISFSTNLNLCSSDRIQFRIYATGAYVGNVTGGMISIVKVSDRIGCH